MPIIKTATAFDRKRVDRITPIPGAVWRDRRWQVKGIEHGGRTDMHAARMEADHNDSDRGIYTRAHEMVHTVISPERPPSAALNGEAYVVLEETQVHAYMQSHLDLPASAYEKHEADKQEVFENALPSLATMTRRQRAMLAVALGDSGSVHDRVRIKTLMDNDDDASALDGIISHAIMYTPDRYDDHEHARQSALAAKFDLLFTEPDDNKDEEQDESESESSSTSASGEDEDEEGDDEEDDDEEREAGKTPPKPKEPTEAKKKEDYKRTGAAAEWGEMRIEKPPLVTPSKALRLLQRRRPLDSGSRISNITRIVSDGLVFGEKKRVQGGTVLVDTSGSMGITVEDMKHLLDTAPAATVAIYAEAYSYGPTPYGILRVVVDKGRMAAPDQLHIGSGNLVDGPALEWLEKQPEPRFWISDGYVIGSNGSGVDHIRFCTNICKRGRILRLNDIPSAIERLTGRKEVKSA